jgi:hypothetical protein
MKNIKVLLLAIGVLAATSVFAQNSSRLTGKEFKVFINKTELPGPETQIEDIITFTGNKVNSQYTSARGSQSSRFTEKQEGTKTLFQMTLTQKNGEVWVFDGFMEDNHMGGSLTITRTGQAPESWEFRGMTTQLWDANIQRREAERQNSY